MIKSNIQNYFELFKHRILIGKSTGEFEDYSDSVFEICKTNLNLSIDDETLLLVKRMLDSEFQIFQPDGYALLDDYDHDLHWYSRQKNEANEFYWWRYKKYLTNKGWNDKVIDRLEHDTLEKLMNFLGDPNSNEHFSRKGLVMGDVQSGKTSNYIGLMCKAVDAGYKVIILLTGTLESLRRQTQIRVEEGFIGYDTENKRWVGVGKGIDQALIPGSGTSRINDFTGTSGDNTYLHLNNSKTPLVFVTKKNSKVLYKIRNTLTNLNIKPPASKIESSLLIIDDEADNASVNTNRREYDPTAINKEIRELINLFSKANYVGFTATPFANIFIDPNSETEMLKSDLFPKDFIFALQSPSHYQGPEKLFLSNGENIEIIDDENDVFPLNHKKDWSGTSIFNSLKQSICAFMLVNSIRDLREGEFSNSHRSMLVNVSRFIKVQETFENLIKNFYDSIVRAIRYSRNLTKKEYIKNDYIKMIYEVYQAYFGSEFTWDEVFERLLDSIKDIQIYKFPFKTKGMQLDYEKHEDKGLRVIVIGGLALSRGLTLEGLTISYLYRNTATFDVLMQMGRWFGYRNKPVDYSDLCHVWMREKTKQYFTEITTSIKQLKEDFRQLVEQKKSPEEFGIRVRNQSDELNITSLNKMRSSRKVIYNYDLYGKVLETPFIINNPMVSAKNHDIVINLVNSLHFIPCDKAYIARDIDKNSVIHFLKNFEIHEANRVHYFEKDKICDFIQKSLFDLFDIVLVNGDGKVVNVGDLKLYPVVRVFDTLNSETIRINGPHYRLGGKEDTRFGLSKEFIKEIRKKDRINASSYLVEGRKPLLLIYPIELKDSTNNDEINIQMDEVDLIRSIVRYYDSSGKILFGIGIGFPKSKYHMANQTVAYYTNPSTKWWELMIEKDNQDDV